MPEMGRLLGWFEAGRLVRPSAEELNFVDLVRALARLAGVEGLPAGAGVEELCRRIGPADHYVFVLIDGLGMGPLSRLPPGGFLPSHLVGRLQSVFLSTTAAALTTLATGQWPCAHGVPGWWAYLDQHEMSIVTLPFVERSTGRGLTELGVLAEEVFPVPSIWPGPGHDHLTVLPGRITDTVYSRYACGGSPMAGYADLSAAFAIVREAVVSARGPTFTYLYLPQLDALSHVNGSGHELVGQVLAELDERLAALAEALAGRARLVIGSDHGQIDVTDERRRLVPADDPMLSHLLCQPTGEPTVPIFHVRGGHEESFASEFARRFGDCFALLSPQELEELQLLGPAKLSATMKRRLGTFVGIAPQPATFYAVPSDGNPASIGTHGGLSSGEMHVPLMLA